MLVYFHQNVRSKAFLCKIATFFLSSILMKLSRTNFTVIWKVRHLILREIVNLTYPFDFLTLLRLVFDICCSLSETFKSSVSDELESLTDAKETLSDIHSACDIMRPLADLNSFIKEVRFRVSSSVGLRVF
jgi:hypothetical protein